MALDPNSIIQTPDDLNLNIPSQQPQTPNQQTEEDPRFKKHTGIMYYIDLAMRNGGLVPGRDNDEIKNIQSNILNNTYTPDQIEAIKYRNPSLLNVIDSTLSQKKKSDEIKSTFGKFFEDPKNPDLLGAAAEAEKIGNPDLAEHYSKLYHQRESEKRLSQMRSGSAFLQKKMALDEQLANGQIDEKQYVSTLNGLISGKTDKQKDEGPNLSKEDLDFMAEQAWTGDASVFQGLGYGNKGAANRAALRSAITRWGKAHNKTGKDIAAMNAEFSGIKAGERTLGTRSANIETAVSEAQNVIPLALDASSKVDRSKYPTLNSILIAAKKGTGDENVVRLGAATNTVINVYARAVSPTGQPTINDKEHAREILDASWSKGQYAAALDQLQKEMDAARKSPGQVRSSLRSAITGKEEPQTQPQKKTVKWSELK